MTYDDIISAIDHLNGDAIAVFGRGSKTQVALAKLYATACAEAKEFEEDDQPSDEAEYVAAHACSVMHDAREINRRYGCRI